MKKSSLNRKFRRALAASLGAVAFASTSCVINAVDPMLYRQRDVANFLAHVGGDMEQLNLKTDNKNVAKLALGGIDIGGGQTLGFRDGFQEEIKADKDYRIMLTVGGTDINLPVRLKRNTLLQPGKEYRICPDIKEDLSSIIRLLDADQKIGYNRWARSRWTNLFRSLERKIERLEKAEAKKAEENAREERKRLEREKALMNNSGNQTVQVPSTTLNPGLITTALLPALTVPSMMNNTTPVQTTTSSMVNTGNAMGTKVGTNADINNIDPQINHNANVVKGKTKT